MKQIKAFSSRFKSTFSKMNRKVKKDQSGQGMTEYALLLLVIVACVAIFKNHIKSAIESKMGNVADSIKNFSGDN